VPEAYEFGQRLRVRRPEGPERREPGALQGEEHGRGRPIGARRLPRDVRLLRRGDAGARADGAADGATNTRTLAAAAAGDA